MERHARLRLEHETRVREPHRDTPPAAAAGDRAAGGADAPEERGAPPPARARARERGARRSGAAVQLVRALPS